MRILEGRWDCSRCGHHGNRGPELECAGCGSARSSSDEIYLPDDAREVTDANQIKQALAGADWQCEHCETESHAFHEDCQQCGAPRGGRPARPVVEVGPSGYNPRPITPQPRAVAATAAPLRTPVRQSSLGRVMLITSVVIACLFGGIYLLFFRGHERTLTISGFNWERTVEVEAYKTVSEEDWSIPAGGRQTGSYRAVHHYNRVLDHYDTVQVPYRTQTGTRTVHHRRNLGNGHYSDYTTTEPVYGTRYRSEKKPVYRNDPVYDTKYRYDIERWVQIRTERAASDDHEPQWPTVTLATKERRGVSHETYTTTFRDPEQKTYTRQYPLANWQAQSVNETFTGVFNAVGSLLEIRELKLEE